MRVNPATNSGQNLARRVRLGDENERRHARVSATLKGRGLLADGTEFELQTLDVSAGGMCLVADVRPKLGEKIIVYLELIGGLEGEVVRLTADGFGMSFRVTLRKREQIADQLTWLINREHLGDDGRRGDERIRPRLTDYTLSAEDGDMAVKLLDVSRSGVAIVSSTRPAVGSWVMIGRTRARVVRHIPSGFAAEFARVIPMELFDADIIL